MRSCLGLGFKSSYIYDFLRLVLGIKLDHPCNVIIKCILHICTSRALSLTVENNYL